MLEDEHIRKHCHVCFSEQGKNGPLLRCSGCKLVHYCSASCKEDDSAIHKVECKALSSLQAKVPQKDLSDPGFRVRMVARVIWQRMLLGEKWFEPIESLMIYKEDDIPGDTLAKLLDYLFGSIDDPDLDMHGKLAKLGLGSIEEVKTIFRRVVTNYIIVPSKLSVGKALSPIVSTLNHSCEANLVYVTPKEMTVKNCLHLVAIKDIKPGEELTITYLASFMPYLFRQADLRAYYLIQECDCSLCVMNKNAIEGRSNQVDGREALWCGRPECDGWVALDWKDKKPKPRGLCTGCQKPCILDSQKITSALARGKAFFDQVGFNSGKNLNGFGLHAGCD